MQYEFTLTAIYYAVGVTILNGSTEIVQRLHSADYAAITEIVASQSSGVAVWCSGSVVGRINEVALHRTRLVLG